MTPGSIRGVRKKKCMQAHRRPRFPRPYLTAVPSPFARHHRLPLSLSIRRFMQPPTPLHHLLFPPQGHPNAFPPPTTTLPPVRYRSSSDGIPGATIIDDPAAKGVDGVVCMCVCVCVCVCVCAAYSGHTDPRAPTRSKIIEKMLDESGIAGASPTPPPPPPTSPSPSPRPSTPRSTVIFFPSGFVWSVCTRFPLARACALLRCALRFQHRPTRREIGNLKSNLRR